MEPQNLKCVMVINEDLPMGIISNSTAVMGITIGKLIPQVVGCDVYDMTGDCHTGIIEFPVPILKGTPVFIKELRKNLYQYEFNELIVVDFSDTAQGCKTYDEYKEKIAKIPESDLNYFGIAICGNKKQVNKLTGSLLLLR